MKPSDPKIPLSVNRSIAGLRAMIHILPVGGAVVLTVLNVRGQFYGKANSWIQVLQFVAKAHEMLMQASIAFAVLSYTRHLMVSHAPIPFGSLLAGLQINQLSYLWSTEFWAALSTDSFRSSRKALFGATISVSVLLAAGVGPSSAIAMIPRQTNFHSGTWKYWFQGNESDMFPQLVDARNVDAACASSGRPGDWNLKCPSRRWQSLQPWLSELASVLPPEGSGGLPQSPPVLLDPLAPSPISVCNTQTELQQCPLLSVISTTTYFPISELAVQNANLWLSANLYSDRLTQVSSLYIGEAKQPFVAASCLDFELRDNRTDAVTFPTWETWTGQALETATDPPISQTDVWSAMDTTKSSQILWIDASTHNFSNTSIAAIVRYPISCGDSCVEAASCVVRAAWGDSPFNITINPWGDSFSVQGYTFGAPWINMSLWPTPPLRILPAWAQFLTPNIFESTETVADMLITTSTDSGSLTYHAQNLLSTLISNGLSQYLWTSVIYDQPTTEQESKLYPFVLKIFDQGLAYSTEGTPIKLAIAVLLFYCVYAIVHTVYTVVSGTSSNAWDSMAEVVALAYRSTPSDALKNTGAGIESIETFRCPVNVEVVEEHLELLFGDASQIRSRGPQSVARNKEYG